MRELLLRLARKAANALGGLFKRFANNTAQNSFEQMLFDSLRTLILQYGRV